MTSRLGRALADSLRARSRGHTAFVLVEGIPTGTAVGLSEAWDDQSMPRLAVVSPHPVLFGRHALLEASGTQLRNSAGERGVVLVLCDGEQLPDRQSLNMFESVSLSTLLEDAAGLALLSQQDPPVEMDGPARAVRAAIVELGPAARPSPSAVSDYLDRLAAGGDPLGELPALGGFTDRAPSGRTVDSSRVVGNLTLASRRTSDDVLRPGSYADMRKRAQQILARRRPAPADPAWAAADVMADLQQGSPALLAKLSYDEARELLERRPEDLTATVKRELVDFRATALPGSQAEGLPWDDYSKLADELGRGARQREAAGELCDLDDAHQRAVFSRETRRKLERSLRDRAVDGSRPSCPEAAIARAAEQLGGLIHRVQLLEPQPPADGSAHAGNRSRAGRVLTLACARLRLGGLLNDWAAQDEDVDGLLTRPADDADLGGREGLLAALGDVDFSGGGGLPPLRLRLHADDKAGTTVQVDWRPDYDDVALLRAVLLFAGDPCLTLLAENEPTLEAFCSGQPLRVAAVPNQLRPLAQRLRDTAEDALRAGLTPALLNGWAAAWTSAVEALRAEGSEDDAEAAALAGSVRAERCAALTGLAPPKAEWLAQHLQALWKLPR